PHRPAIVRDDVGRAAIVRAAPRICPPRAGRGPRRRGSIATAGPVTSGQDGTPNIIPRPGTSFKDGVHRTDNIRRENWSPSPCVARPEKSTAERLGSAVLDAAGTARVGRRAVLADPVWLRGPSLREAASSGPARRLVRGPAAIPRRRSGALRR